MANSLITTEQFKKTVAVQNSVDKEMLEPFLSQAEDLWLRPLLGEELYNNFRQAFDDETLSPMYETLYSFAVPFLAYFAFYEYIPFSYAHFTNKGIVKNGSEVDLDDMTFLRASVLGTAKAYEKNLSDWLATNTSSFLPFVEDCTETKHKFIGGMAFKKGG